MSPSSELLLFMQNSFNDVVVNRDTSVGIPTRYVLDGPGMESGGGELFRTISNRPWGPNSLLYNLHPVSFSRIKRPGSGVDHPPLSSGEVKERVDYAFIPPLCLHVRLQGELYLLTMLSIAHARRLRMPASVTCIDLENLNFFQVSVHRTVVNAIQDIINVKCLRPRQYFELNG
jgi:hypothetical protein